VEHLRVIEKLVRRVRWRIRVQTALRRFLVFGALGLLCFGVAVLLVKARVLPVIAVPGVGAAAALVTLAAVLTGLLRRLDDVGLAAALDAAGGLHSRLGSALAFARSPDPSPFERAAIEDAASVLERASPRRAAPWQWAAFGGAAALAVGAVALTVPAVFAIDFPVGRLGAAAVGTLGDIAGPLERVKVEVLPHEREVLAALAEELEDARRALPDEEVQRLLADLNDLVRALRDGEITPEEAHGGLAALDKAAEEWRAAHAEDLAAAARHVREAAEKTRRPHRELDPLFDALREERLREAAEALERTAEALERDDGLSRRDRQRIQRELAALADALQTARQREEQRLRRDRDRLRREEERLGDRMPKRDRDRLRDTQRELERLEREQQEALSEVMRELERLQRQLDAGAQDLLQRLAEQQQRGPGGAGDMSAEQLRQAAEALRRMGERGQAGEQLRLAEGRMGEIKEMLRQAGQRGQDGQGGPQERAGRERGGQEGRDGATAGGQRGQRGQEPGAGGDQRSELERFLEQAGGEQGRGGAGGDQRGPGDDGDGGEQGGAAARGGEPRPGAGQQGDDGMVMLGPGGQATALRPGPAIPGQGAASGEGERPGEGVGHGHDPRLLGEASPRLPRATREDFVPGVRGDGPTASKVVMSAASRGFATRGYRDVHQDYREVVEDALERERIPPGQRTYVRRYFDLIRPR